LLKSLKSSRSSGPGPSSVVALGSSGDVAALSSGGKVVKTGVRQDPLAVAGSAGSAGSMPGPFAASSTPLDTIRPQNGFSGFQHPPGNPRKSLVAARAARQESCPNKIDTTMKTCSYCGCENEVTAVACSACGVELASPRAPEIAPESVTVRVAAKESETAKVIVAEGADATPAGVPPGPSESQ
jgi:hypothetical protein